MNIEVICVIGCFEVGCGIFDVMCFDVWMLGVFFGQVLCEVGGDGFFEDVEWFWLVIIQVYEDEFFDVFEWVVVIVEFFMIVCVDEVVRVFMCYFYFVNFVEEYQCV